MAAPIFPGRHTADIEGEFVVFVIGMRVNRPWKLRKWLSVARAMPPMVAHLEAHPEAGCLATRRGMFSPLQPMLIQYWRSFEDLERFARGDALHSEPWKAFFRIVGLGGDVGIWHETFQVRAGDYECIYTNMPRVGLARAGGHRGLGSAARDGARDRMGAGAGQAG
jgi:hypothetical protein